MKMLKKMLRKILGCRNSETIRDAIFRHRINFQKIFYRKKIEIEDFAGTKETQVIYAYNISKYEITQGLYKAVMGENPSKFEGSENPVERVSCYYILDYITSLVLKKVIIKK